MILDGNKNRAKISKITFYLLYYSVIIGMIIVLLSYSVF